MFAFSTCWNSHRHTDGRAMLNEVRELGFEYAELGHGTRISLLDGIQQAVAANEIKISSLHNFCPLPFGVSGPAPDYYLPSSQDKQEHDAASRHTLRTIDCAAQLGAGVVVLHLGVVRMRNYTARLLDLQARGKADTRKFLRLQQKAMAVRTDKRQRYFDAVQRLLDAVVPHARESRVRLGLETRFGIEEIPSEMETEELIQRFGLETTGYWHDVGHAQIKENLGLLTHESILEHFRGRTAGMHLQDFAPPAFDHQPPGFGSFKFERLTPFVTDDMILTWEIHPEWKAQQIATEVKEAQAVLRKSVNV